MKNQIVRIVVLVIACMLGVSSQASELPIFGQDVARESVIGSVTRGFRSVQSESLIELPNHNTWVEAEGNGAEDVLDKLLGSEIKYALANPNDKIVGHIWLYDKDDNFLFYGRADYLASDLGGKGPGPQYGVWMQKMILSIENVQSAEVLALDENGFTTRIYPQGVDEDGRIHFDYWMAGAQNGILSVRFEDGSVSIYNLWSPEASDPVEVSENRSSWKIDGHHVFRLSPKDTVLVNVIETWQKPTVLITVSSRQTVKFDVLGLVDINGNPFFERPNSFVFIQVDGPWSGSGLINKNGPTIIGFPAPGKYRVRFPEWDNFGKSGTIYAGPEFDDGVGKGVSSPPSY